MNTNEGLEAIAGMGVQVALYHAHTVEHLAYLSAGRTSGAEKLALFHEKRRDIIDEARFALNEFSRTTVEG